MHKSISTAIFSIHFFSFAEFALSSRMYTAGQKNCTTNLWPKLCQILTDHQNSFTGKFFGKFAVKQLWIPPHLAHVAALTCKN